jgi:hypothetical protein
VGQPGKLLQIIPESDTDQETMEANKHIHTSVSERYLIQIQRVRGRHVTGSDPPTGPESHPPRSPTYLPDTELMASPASPGSSAALAIVKDTEHAKQRFSTCFEDLCLIYKDAKTLPSTHKDPARPPILEKL